MWHGMQHSDTACSSVEWIPLSTIALIKALLPSCNINQHFTDKHTPIKMMLNCTSLKSISIIPHLYLMHLDTYIYKTPCIYHLEQVYTFFSTLFPSSGSKYQVFNYWRGPIRNDDYFFIRVATMEVTDKSVGLGVDRPEEKSGDISNFMKIQGKRYLTGNDAAWWYVSTECQVTYFLMHSYTTTYCTWINACESIHSWIDPDVPNTPFISGVCGSNSNFDSIVV